MSQAIASSQPPPRAKPETAATIGLVIPWNLSQRSIKGLSSMVTGVAFIISLMSAPAANARSVPATTRLPISGRVSNASSADSSSVMSSWFSALRACGRLISTMPTRPSLRATIYSYATSSILFCLRIPTCRIRHGNRQAGWAIDAISTTGRQLLIPGIAGAVGQERVQARRPSPPRL